MKKELKSLAGAAVFYLGLYWIFGCILPKIYDPDGAMLNSEFPKRLTLYHRDWFGGKEITEIRLREDTDGKLRWMLKNNVGKWERVWFRDEDYPDEMNVN